MPKPKNLDYLEKQLRRLTGKAVADYGMIEAGDKVMVCVSGGKDSYTLLEMMLFLQKSAPIDFELVAVNLDQGQPGFPKHILPEYFAQKKLDHKVVEMDTYSIVKRIIPEGDTTCSLCSRLRRGILYDTADELGCTKIALGHHREDYVETVFLNLFYGGLLKGMSPKLQTDDGRHIVIRPLIYCKEGDIQRYADERQFPIIPCDLCGSQPNLQRKVVKQMLAQWNIDHPGRVETIFRGLRHVIPSHLADAELYDFSKVQLDNPQRDGDKAIDEAAACGDMLFSRS